MVYCESRFVKDFLSGGGFLPWKPVRFDNFS